MLRLSTRMMLLQRSPSTALSGVHCLGRRSLRVPSNSLAPQQIRVSPSIYRSFSTTKDSTQLDFHNTEEAFRSKTTLEIVRSLLVFKMCQIGPLVNNAETLYKKSLAIVGPNVVGLALRQTFFKHFCGGEDEVGIAPRVAELNKYGVGGIFDYAAEADVEEDTTESSVSTDQPARVYDYTNELECDQHLETFLSCVRSVKNVSPTGFAAIKITALGNPQLLKRLNTALVTIRDLFAPFSHDGVHLTRDEFMEAYNTYIIENEDNVASRSFQRFDKNNDGFVDLYEWTKGVDLQQLARGVMKDRFKEEHDYALTDEEIPLLDALITRLDTICKEAHSLGVRVMIDQEQTYYRSVIDNLTVGMQRKYNLIEEHHPTVFATYQCYLKGSVPRIERHMKRAQDDGYIFACKIVRGAYMVAETELAEAEGVENPIQDSLEDTHASYNTAMENILTRKANGQVCELMVASHNEDSVKLCVNLMSEKNLPTNSGVYFGQLLGMSDHLTFTLGQADYKAYKYVPYGPILEVVPYMIRRLQENSNLLGGVGQEVQLLQRELIRRMTPWK